MGDLLRSKEMADRYQAHKESGVMDTACVLCEAPAIESFTYWKVIPNNFPYDRIARTHEMIIPLRHVREEELIEEERDEFFKIKGSYLQKYDYLLEATYKTKSIPQHFHIHLIIGKEIE